MQVEILRVNGASEQIETTRERALDDIRKAIGAETLDTVNLRDGRIMLVNDRGYDTVPIKHSPTHTELRPTRALLPVNAKATALYHAICIPGTTHQIVGDVGILVDADLADPDDPFA